MPQHFTATETIAEIAAKLASHPLFACLDLESRLAIAQRSQMLRFAAGTVLMRQGEAGDFACLVVDGAVDIFVEIAAGPVQVATLGQDQIVGELGLLTDAPRNATAVAQTDTMAIRIERELLLNLVATYPAIGLHIIRELGHRLNAMNPALAYLTEAANALGRDEYDPAMLGQLTNEPGLFAGFARAFAQMVVELRNKQSRHQEMLAAAVIQASILPPPFLGVGSAGLLDLHAETHPAREIGGDFYDYFMLDDGRLAVTIADVAGKGIPAALYMAVSRTIMRSVASIADLAARVKEANRLLSENAASMFVTMFHGVLNVETGSLVYCNAGHNPPYLLRAEGFEILKPTGPAFGLDTEMIHRVGNAVLGRADTLFLFTDGLTEAIDSTDEEFGTNRLEAALAHWHGLTSQEIVAAVLADVKSFVRATEQSDDITCLALRIRPQV